MQWDKQTETNLNGWLGTSQKVWENWWDVLANSTQNGNRHPSYPGLPMFDMTYNFWDEMAKQWRTTMEQNFQSFSPQMTDSAQLAMQQFAFGQEYAQQLVKITADAWQTIMLNTTSPDEWQQALETYMVQLRSQMADATDVNRFMENSTQLWQVFGQEMQKFSQPWLGAWMQFPQHMSRLAGSQEKANPLLAMMNLTWDTYSQTFGRMTNMPSIGLMREFNEKVNRSFATWQENQRISVEYQIILGDALLSAIEAYMQKLLEQAKSAEMPSSQNALLSLWVDVADDVFIELFHSERYAEIQSRYVNSSMALRQQQRELTETMLRMNDLPTRSDLDEAHKNIFELRREVKSLKKALADVSRNDGSEADAASATNAKSTKSTRSTNSKLTNSKSTNSKSATTKSKTTKSSGAKSSAKKPTETADKGA